MGITTHLKLNVEKSQVNTDSNLFKGIDEVKGIKRAQSVKYLGFTITLQKAQLIKDAKSGVRKHVNILRTTIRTKDPRVY